MRNTTTLTISLPEPMRQFIESQVSTKGFGNVSEYFRSLVREAQEREEKARLESLLLEGLTTGGGVEVTPEFWADLRTEAAQRLQKLANSRAGVSSSPDLGCGASPRRS